MHGVRVYGWTENDVWKRKVLSFEWKGVEVMDGDSGDDGRDEKTMRRLGCEE